MENSIEEDIAKVNTYIELVLEKDYCNCNELNTILGKHCDGSKNVAYAIEHILSDYKRVLKENEELKVVKSVIQTLQINSIEDEKYIVISKSSSLDGSYKHLLDDYIPIQKVKDKIRKNEEIIDISNDGDLIHELLQKNKVYEELLESEE